MDQQSTGQPARSVPRVNQSPPRKRQRTIAALEHVKLSKLTRPNRLRAEKTVAAPAVVKIERVNPKRQA